MQIEKALINDRLPISRVAYLLTVSVIFSVYKQNFAAQ